jgi:acyl-homoserine lactone acylase PvdQ
MARRNRPTNRCNHRFGITTRHRFTLRWIKAMVLVVTCASLTAAEHPHASAKVPDTLRVSGLNQPVEILRDRWGINHIYAKNEHDLFFAQGYSVARDRLFQLELWRRQATGTVAEILGPRELNRDIGARLHMFRGNLMQELNWYHPHGEEIVTAFVRGINAYIDEALRDPSGLPPEFKLLGIKPGKWTPAVVISRHNGLLGNAVEELRMAQAAKIIGVEAVKTLSQFYGSPILNVDPAVDLSLVNGSVLELYNAFRGPIEFTPQDVVAAYRSDERGFQRLTPAAMTGTLSIGLSQEDTGSNKWVVSGSLTQSGRPLLANDPHRAQGAPSLRYWVHLAAPGWNVIGSGEPAMPGVSIGHNEFGAWGLTIFGTDTEDLYVYETNPANPSQYKYRGAWDRHRTDPTPLERPGPRARGWPKALAQLRRMLGPDMAKWQYGQEKYHYAFIHHPLAAALKPEVRSQFDAGPVPRGGDSYTVTQQVAPQSNSGQFFQNDRGYRDWDNSVGLNNPGQSGDPRSPHYCDLFEPWSRGKYFPSPIPARRSSPSRSGQ